MEADDPDLPPCHFTHQAHMDRMICGVSVSDADGQLVDPITIMDEAPALPRRRPRWSRKPVGGAS